MNTSPRRRRADRAIHAMALFYIGSAVCVAVGATAWAAVVAGDQTAISALQQCMTLGLGLLAGFLTGTSQTAPQRDPNTRTRSTDIEETE
jgi:hypothetical protein